MFLRLFGILIGSSFGETFSMKTLNIAYKALLIFLWIDLVLIAECFCQTKLSGDTLTTQSGFKIYPGQRLTFSTGTGNGGTYRFVRSGNIPVRSDYSSALVLVEKVGRLEASGLGNVYIHLTVRIFFQDGSITKSNLKLNFNKALDSNDGFHPELL